MVKKDKKNVLSEHKSFRSGRPGSNRRQPAWKARALSALAVERVYTILTTSESLTYLNPFLPLAREVCTHAI